MNKYPFPSLSALYNLTAMPIIPVLDGELLVKRMTADMPEIAHSTLVKRLADMYGVTKSILGEDHTKLDVFGVSK